jgi:hypothetical protein
VKLYYSDKLLWADVGEKSDGVGNTVPHEEYRPVNCGTAVERFTEWAEDSVSPVLSDGENMVAVGDPHRFAPRYRKRQYARLQALSRNISEEYGALLHTAMITLSASNEPYGEVVPIVDHLDELLSSWESVRRELSRQLEGYDWEYIGILEPHKSGYAHIHIGVFVRGVVDESTFRPVVDRHLSNCEYAGSKAHEDSITVHRSGVDRKHDASDLGAYLAAYMGESFVEDEGEGLDKLEFEASPVPPHVLRFWTAIWATGTQQFRPSNGAQEYMKGDYEKDDEDEEEKEWEMVGIVDGVHQGQLGDDVEVIRCDSGGGGRLKTSLGELQADAEERWAGLVRRRRGVQHS